MAERFEDVLDEFNAVRDLQTLSVDLAPTRIGELLHEHNLALANDDVVQRSSADDFDLLDVLGMTGLEQLHCRALAWLLDHRRRRFGTHAQQTLGFELFLNAVDLPASYATTEYEVRREVSGDRSRIDVEVACRGRFLIHIEVKVFAATRTSQLAHEAVDAKLRAAALGIDIPAIHLFYLTRSGRKPAADTLFIAVSWGSMAKVFDGLRR